MRKDIKILPGPTSSSAISAGKIPLLTGETLETEASDRWIEESKLTNVQNAHRIEQDLRKAILLLPYYSGNHPYTLCFWRNKLFNTVQLADLSPAYRLPSPHPSRMRNHPDALPFWWHIL